MRTCTGFRTGRQLAERYTANRARLGEPLEVIKFVCKEFWTEVFRKQACACRADSSTILCFGCAATSAYLRCAQLLRQDLLWPLACARTHQN